MTRESDCVCQQLFMQLQLAYWLCDQYVVNTINYPMQVTLYPLFVTCYKTRDIILNVNWYAPGLISERNRNA